MSNPERSAQSPSKLLGHRPGQHSLQVLMQEVPEETNHSERLDQLGLGLDRGTSDALTSLAQRRPVVYQVGVLLRQTLARAFSYPTTAPDEDSSSPTRKGSHECETTCSPAAFPAR